MKIFAVYSRLNFIKKPEWLDGFRNKYNYPYTYHVTLKQPTYIQEEEIVNVKNVLAGLFSELKFPEHKIGIVFDKLVIDTPIMIAATRTEEIAILQDKIVKALESYNNLVKPESKNWEEDFKPHITITDDLDAGKYMKFLKKVFASPRKMLNKTFYEDEGVEVAPVVYRGKAGDLHFAFVWSTAKDRENRRFKLTDFGGGARDYDRESLSKAHGVIPRAARAVVDWKGWGT